MAHSKCSTNQVFFSSDGPPNPFWRVCVNRLKEIDRDYLSDCVCPLNSNLALLECEGGPRILRNSSPKSVLPTNALKCELWRVGWETGFHLEVLTAVVSLAAVVCLEFPLRKHLAFLQWADQRQLFANPFHVTVQRLLHAKPGRRSQPWVIQSFHTDKIRPSSRRKFDCTTSVPSQVRE